MKMNCLLVLLFLWLGFPALGETAFPAGYLPNGPRPRMWLEQGSLDISGGPRC